MWFNRGGGFITRTFDIFYINFDFVKPTDDAVLQDASEKFGLPVEEIDRIILSIESIIFI